MDFGEELLKVGLTNRNTEDIGALSMGKRSSYEAFCDSGRTKACGLKEHVAYNKKGQKHITRSFHMTLKRVEGEPDLCPDCGHTLVWKRKKL